MVNISGQLKYNIFYNDAMNSIRNTSCSYNLCNLSSHGTVQLMKRFNIVVFTIYSAKVSNWSSYYTGITIATGLPWSNSFGFTMLRNASGNTLDPVGVCKMNGSSCVVTLKSNSAFDLCHIYQV